MRFLRDLDFGAVSVNTHAPMAARDAARRLRVLGYGKDLGSYGLEDYTRHQARGAGVSDPAILTVCSVRTLPPRPSTPPGSPRRLAPHGRSTLLPREAYVDPAVLAWEQRELLRRLGLPGPEPPTSPRPAASARSRSAAPACC